MTKKQILSVVKNLAKSQGFYGRVLKALEESPKALANLAALDFIKDEVDLVEFLESGIEGGK
jgi:hypothetical protein